MNKTHLPISNCKHNHPKKTFISDSISPKSAIQLQKPHYVNATGKKIQKKLTVLHKKIRNISYP